MFVIGCLIAYVTAEPENLGFFPPAVKIVPVAIWISEPTPDPLVLLLIPYAP